MKKAQPSRSPADDACESPNPRPRYIALTLEEARKVIERLRDDEGMRHDLQFAIGGS